MNIVIFTHNLGNSPIYVIIIDNIILFDVLISVTLSQRCCNDTLHCTATNASKMSTLNSQYTEKVH